MRCRRTFAAVLGTMLFTGCDSETLLGNHRQLDPGASRVVTASSEHRIVGSGHVEQTAGLREFTFHAIQHPDGSVSGSYKIVLPNGLFFETDVTCMTVNGNTGWVAGLIRATNAAAVLVGSVSTVFVIDNGEGEEAGDIVSLATFNGAAGADAAFCANTPLALAQLAVANGNVQVR